MNVGIAFGGSYVIEVTLVDGVSLCSTCIFKLYHAPREAFGEGTQHNCMQVLQYIFCLKLSCKCCIVKIVKVYQHNEDIALLIMQNYHP
jgi:hypothetical protein